MLVIIYYHHFYPTVSYVIVNLRWQSDGYEHLTIAGVVSYDTQFVLFIQAGYNSGSTASIIYPFHLPPSETDM